MNATRTQRQYSQLRRQGWRASEAFSHAKDDQRLEDAEDAGLIRFRWETDYDDQDTSWMDEGDLEKMESGYWLTTGCIAEVPARVAVPVVFMGSDDDDTTWTVSGSLWGIVGPFDRTDQDYRRSVEIDLAYESGVLA